MKQKKNNDPKKLTKEEITKILGGNVKRFIVLGAAGRNSPPGSTLCNCKSSVCIA